MHARDGARLQFRTRKNFRAIEQARKPRINIPCAGGEAANAQNGAAAPLDAAFRGRQLRGAVHKCQRADRVCTRSGHTSS